MEFKDDGKPQKVDSESNIAWTLLAVTALTGQPVCCVVIIEGSQFDGVDVTGKDIMTNLSMDVWDFGNKDLHGP